MTYSRTPKDAAITSDTTPTTHTFALDRAGAHEERWLSAPLSRLVLSAVNFDPEPTAMPDGSLSLSAAFYVEDRADRMPAILSVHALSEKIEGDRQRMAACSWNTAWTPAALRFEAHYSAGQLRGFDVLHGLNAMTRVIDESDIDIVVGGDVSGMASYDADTDVITVVQDGFTYAVAASAGTLRLDEDSLETRRDTKNADTIGRCSWSLSVPAGEQVAIGVGFSVGADEPSAASAAAEARQAASVAGARNDVVRWSEFWDDFLRSVPAPRDFTLHDVTSQDIEESAVRAAYYRAWITLQSNVLPATPETGNAFAQLSVGKAALWLYGPPGIRSVASWDSLLGLQYLVHTDPQSAWESFQGLMVAVDDDGSIAGESLPSRKAQTAWVLYEVTGDLERLASTYAALVRHLRWEGAHLRWILGKDQDHPDERDAEFVASLIYDLTFMDHISTAVDRSDDVAEWIEFRERLTQDFEAWFFPATGPYPVINRVFFDAERTEPAWVSDNPAGAFRDATTGQWTDPGLAQYTTTALAISGLSDSHVDRVLARFYDEYDPEQQLAGLGSVRIKAPDAQLMVYGLLDRGRFLEASVIIHALTRDIVRAGQFVEEYRASSHDVADSPIPAGVAPSVFGMVNLIDNIWLTNGVRMEAGTPTFVRVTGGLEGGVSRLRYRGERYAAALTDGGVELHGPAVDNGTLPPFVALNSIGASVSAQQRN